MRVAGVRVSGGRMAWVDAGGYHPSPGKTVRLRLAGDDETGTVVITPERFLRPPETVEGEISELVEAERNERDTMILGADLPPLGVSVRTQSGTGVVTGLEPVERTVIVRDSGGQSIRHEASDVREVSAIDY